MAITVGIFNQSGGGKSTSIVINPDGTYNPADYKGMNPETTVVINSDTKRLPFKSEKWIEGTNLFTNSDINYIIWVSFFILKNYHVFFRRIDLLSSNVSISILSIKMIHHHIVR